MNVIVFVNLLSFPRQTCRCEHCGFSIRQSAPRSLHASWPGDWTPPYCTCHMTSTTFIAYGWKIWQIGSWTSELPTWLPTCQNSAKLNFAQVWVYLQPSQDALKFVMLLSTPSSAMRWVILVQRVRSCWSDTERMSFVSLSRITHDSCVTIKYLCVAIASNWAGWTLCENFHSSFSLIPRLPQPGNDTNHPYHDNFWIEMLFYIITVEPLQLAWWNL